MHVDDAVLHTIADYPGGAEALAPRLGTSAAVLRNKANPRNDRNIVTLRDARLAMTLTGDLRILHALAAEQDCIVLPIGTEGEADLATLTMDRSAAEGDLSRVIRDAVADGVITRNEMAAIQRATGDTQRAMVAMLRRLAGLMPRAPEPTS